MTTLARVRVVWTGDAVAGGGLSTFYTVGAGADLQDDVRNFFTAIKNHFPVGLTWQVQTSGETIDDNTGEINGAWSGGTGGNITGNDPALYAKGVGARVRWETAGLTGGRRVRGSTFLLPLRGAAYDTSGTIATDALGVLQTAADGLVSAQAGALVILTRLTPSHSGTSHEVTSAVVPDKVSWLRTRRD